MLKHIYLILIATFIFGFTTGAVTFLYNNTGEEGDGSLESDTKGFTITAYIYGGCTRIGCPSYRITDYGSYMYIMRNNTEGDRRIEDVLSSTQKNVLTSVIANTNFEQVLSSEFTDMCPITYDGVAYQYDIEYEGVRYELDSCIHDLEKEKLFEVLTGYFEVFQITYGTI